VHFLAFYQNIETLDDLTRFCQIIKSFEIQKIVLVMSEMVELLVGKSKKYLKPKLILAVWQQQRQFIVF
jgi:hypothetical protein